MNSYYYNSLRLYRYLELLHSTSTLASSATFNTLYINGKTKEPEGF